jgi:hypothetical protein
MSNKVLSTIDLMMRSMPAADLVAVVQHAAVHYNAKAGDSRLTWDVVTGQQQAQAAAPSPLTQAAQAVAEVGARRGGPGIWAKTVKSVDFNATNGHAINGDWARYREFGKLPKGTLIVMGKRGDSGTEFALLEVAPGASGVNVWGKTLVDCTLVVPPNAPKLSSGKALPANGKAIAAVLSELARRGF